MEKPRGIRNNNPGNIVRGTDKWQGLSDSQIDPRFCEFKDPVYGIRAMARLLITYQDKYDCATVQDFISRWAPSVENNTSAYVEAVVRHMGVGFSTVVDMHQYRFLRGMCEAIIGHENGGSWRTWYSDLQMTKAMVLAGVEPERRSLVKSAQVIGGSIAASATVAAPVVQDTMKQIEPLVGYSDTIKYFFVGLALFGVLLTIFAKINERKKGIS